MFNAFPEKFTALFNNMYTGAYRRITADDVKIVTKCRLTGLYGFYLSDDEKESPKCKRCGQPLPNKLMGNKGRLTEYCLEYERLRNAEHQRKFYARKSKQPDKSHLFENDKGL
jgi:hypothetical protein